MPLECKAERCSVGRGLDEVLGTYIFHCPCQALCCFLSLVSQRWCFLKLPLVEGNTIQASSRLKFLAFQFFSHSEWQPGIFPMPGGKRGMLGGETGHARVLFGGNYMCCDMSPSGLLCVFWAVLAHRAAGDEQPFAKLHWYRAGLASLSNPQPEGKY